MTSFFADSSTAGIMAIGLAGMVFSLFLALSTYKAAKVRDWQGAGIALAFATACMISTGRLILAFFH
jgi:hypothetical protein